MKINKLYWLILSILTIFLPVSAIADAKVYDAFTVHNNTDYDLYFHHTSNHCFASGKENGLPYTIKAHTSYSFTEKENNQRGIHTRGRSPISATWKSVIQGT